MSLFLVPEAAAIISPPTVLRPINPRPGTRPVESSDKANADGSDQKQHQPEGAVVKKPEPSARPPGIDPSQPPPSLFEAALICADFKPSNRPAEDLQSPSDANSDSSASDPMCAIENDSAVNSLAGSVLPQKQAADGRTDAAKVAAYTRGAGGTKLSLPPTANPDFLASVQKTA